ncbi:MAG: heme-binding beta-barrel domain-containing protein [Deltaproteobacteria bacterium]|nr:heme-binding beta-barrel domain-containing protein [Deltaproteobacteria bacterium]
MDASPDLGPLAPFLGSWEGDKGTDLAPGADRTPATSLYRERIAFAPLGRVDNHEQVLHGLTYTTMAWRLGAADGFHQETGYLLWDAARQQVMRCFLVPRGMALIAGGTVLPDARTFTLKATLGSPTYGICSNPFLDIEFKTVAFEITLAIDGDTLRYDQDTVLQMKGREALFHHTDRNTLRRIG